MLCVNNHHSFVRLLPLSGPVPDEPIWVRQLRQDCTGQHTCHSSRVVYLIACIGFRSLFKKMPFNIIPPQVQSKKLMHFLTSARFPRQNTIRVIIVHGMFLLSCRIKILGKICDRQYCSGVVWGRYTGLIVPPDLF